MRPRSFRRRFLLTAGLILALLGATVAATPSLRAMAADLLGITRSETDSVTYDQSVAILHGPELRPIAEVQADTPFAIYAPDAPPAGYRFDGAAYNADLGNGVSSVGLESYYAAVADPALSLSVSQIPLADGCQRCPDIGASTPVEQVDVNGVAGSYYVGAWSSSGELESTWDPDYDRQTLQWEAAGFKFAIRAPRGVDKATVIALARSLRP